jgi:hypothetical protein
MARGVNLGRRSRVDPAGRANRRPKGGTNIRPVTDVPVPRPSARFTRSASPFGIRGERGTMRHRRRGRRK